MWGTNKFEGARPTFSFEGKSGQLATAAGLFVGITLEGTVNGVASSKFGQYMTLFNLGWMIAFGTATYLSTCCSKVGNDYLGMLVAAVVVYFHTHGL